MQVKETVIATQRRHKGQYQKTVSNPELNLQLQQSADAKNLAVWINKTRYRQE
jgi:hypothetical protein